MTDPSRIRAGIATPSPSKVHASSTAAATAIRSSTRRRRPSSGARTGPSAALGPGSPTPATASRPRTGSASYATSRGLPTHAVSLIGSLAPVPCAARSPLLRTTMLRVRLRQLRPNPPKSPTLGRGNPTSGTSRDADRRTRSGDVFDRASSALPSQAQAAQRPARSMTGTTRRRGVVDRASSALHSLRAQRAGDRPRRRGCLRPSEFRRAARRGGCPSESETSPLRPH